MSTRRNASGLCECGYERCPSKNLRDSDRQLIENEHNSRRSSLAKGLEHSASGNLPKAVDIYKMSYDCQLEKMAQEYANTCDFKDQPEKHVVVDRNQYTSSATNESTNHSALIHMMLSASGLGAQS
ncbi:unnamed protein product [Toxocara canis]|uniref:SCP domain-containing protein n=1 Tax=Toxocara canis TaxID=6265 RepID=A0A183UV84_TOXCA|nr:unnamed protein product [Toxocara canis]